MKTVQTVKELRESLSALKKSGRRIGFVPTMGALHAGHLSLIDECRKQCDITVCSIFVNPLQFNNRADFEKYPVVTAQDTDLLKAAGCDFLFQPSVKEMYPEEIKTIYDFGGLATVMEGAYRPGHFNGVGVVVKRLFDIVQPEKAFFGEKDYQQYLIIRRLVELHHLNIEIVPCPIVRESDGLALSSRNMRLTESQRKFAPMIYRTLKEAVNKKNSMQPGEIIQWVEQQFIGIEDVKLEYFEISDGKTLEPVRVWEQGPGLIACIAVYVGEIRLIDNVRFFS